MKHMKVKLKMLILVLSVVIMAGFSLFSARHFLEMEKEEKKNMINSSF